MSRNPAALPPLRVSGRIDTSHRNTEGASHEASRLPRRRCRRVGARPPVARRPSCPKSRGLALPLERREMAVGAIRIGAPFEAEDIDDVPCRVRKV